MQNDLSEKFTGSLLGGMIGDVIGAVVEGESPGYIRKTFKSADEILALDAVEEIFGGEWKVGRFTDDTQMTLAVADWLLKEKKLTGKSLLTRFSADYVPWRRYGPGAAMILEAFPKNADKWQSLAKMMFSQGSYGNGSAMRAGPIGLFFHQDAQALEDAALVSSITTHAHPLAIQGATLQATAVALATRASPPLDKTHFLNALEVALSRFQEASQDTSPYKKALKTIAQGISVRFEPVKVAHILGTGIKAQEAVPMAIYCFLANCESFEKSLEGAVFLGGDTDTIACMTASISGAYLGIKSIPERWLARVREELKGIEFVKKLAIELFLEGQRNGFKARASV